MCTYLSERRLGGDRKVKLRRYGICLFLEWPKHWFLDIMCFNVRCSAAVILGKYKYDLTDTFVKAEMPLMEKLTKGALVTTNPEQNG